MAKTCSGKRGTRFQYGLALYRCKKCGNIGCWHNTGCSNEGFSSSKCNQCGAGTAHKEIVN